jgi:folate-binding protein YgfZ
LREALIREGACAVGAEAIDAARIEAGYPVFGVDMTTDTIPLEAGIEDRAISFTKGCYVGQEVIVRVMHRGAGRVARRLMSLRFEGSPPAPGTKLFSGDRETGWVTSAARSPRTGAIGLGYVHRDSAVAGTRLAAGSAGAGVLVSERGIAPDGR